VLATGTLSLTLNAQRELCVLSKAGGTPLGADEIMGVVRVAVDRVRDLIRTLEDALERDRAVRVVEVR
jgi:exosome complex component RRP45